LIFCKPRLCALCAFMCRRHRSCK